MRLAALVMLGALTLTGSASGQAKAVQPHNGFWGGFGLGGGVNLTDLPGDPLSGGGSLWGFNGYFRLGGTLNQRVLLGGESSGWFGSRGELDFSNGNLSAIIMFYPSPRGGVFLKGGVGFAYVSTSIYTSTTVGGIDYQSTFSQGKGGFGATAGLGYDVRLGRNIYLVPEVDWYLQAVGSESTSVFGDIPGTQNVIAFSLGLVWH